MIDIPAISIIMITYGHENYIEEAINGVLMQVCNFDIELIIADDNSPDKTEFIVNRIIKEHDRGGIIKYTRHKINKGMQGNFIWAYEQCRGEYITLCEGDDFWIDPLKLETQLSFLEKNRDFSGSAHDVLITNEDSLISNVHFTQNRIKPKDYYGLKDYIKQECLFHTSSLVYRNSFVKIPEFMYQVMSLDQFIFILFCQDGKIKYFNSPMGCYRIHRKGITQTNLHQNISISTQNQLKGFMSIDSYFKFKFHDLLKIRINKLRFELIKIKLGLPFIKRLIFKKA